MSRRCPLRLFCWLLLLIAQPAVGDEKPAASKHDDPKDDRAAPVFKNGEAQVVDAFKDPDYWLRHDLWVETESDSDEDGRLDRVHVSVTRPRQTETEGLKLPVVYETSPYYAGVAEDAPEKYFWDPHQELGGEPKKRPQALPIKREGMRPIISKRHVKDWVPRGYVVVHSSSPGTGLSQGCPTVLGENEALAPKAVIDWLCGRANGYTTPDGYQRVSAPWCNGRIGMTGTSYNGTLPLAAATTGVEGLEAIIPVAPVSSFYRYYRSNGMVRHPGGYIGEDIDCIYEFIHSGPEELRAGCNCRVRDKLYAENIDRVTGDFNEFWASRDLLKNVDKVRCAVLMSHAFNDWNVMPEQSLRFVDAVRERGLPWQMYYHQGGHGGAPPMKMMNRWFTRYLHGVENDVEKDKRAWIVRENDKRSQPTAYENYPHPEAAPVDLHLEAGAPKQGRLRLLVDEQQGVETLIDNYSFKGAALARAEWTRHRLIYVTPKLQQPLHLSGRPRIKLRVAADSTATNLSVWLVSLPWNNSSRAKVTDNIVTRGWFDPQNHKSLTDGEPLVPGTFYELEFDLQPDDQILPAGQQIGLMIFSSDQDFTLWPTPGTELTLDLDQTMLTLPVVGGEVGWREAFEEKKETPEDDKPNAEAKD